MKKYILISVFILCAFNFETAFAQEKLKEGKATFTFSYPDDEGISEKLRETRAAKGLTIYFKDGRVREEYENKNMNISITDPKKKEIISFYGQMAVINTFEEVEKIQTMFYGDTTAVITNETKMIAGYKCIKAIYTYPVSTKRSTPTEIWFTRDIDATYRNIEYKGVDGFIMEYTSVDKLYPTPEGVDFTEVMTCTGVEKVSVPEEKFKIPEGYEVKTRKEFTEGAKIEYH